MSIRVGIVTGANLKHAHCFLYLFDNYESTERYVVSPSGGSFYGHRSSLSRWKVKELKLKKDLRGG